MVDGMIVWKTCLETNPIANPFSVAGKNTVLSSLQTVSIKINHLINNNNNKTKTNWKTKHSQVPVSVIILSGITAAPKRTICSDIDYLGLPICPQETQSPQQR